MSIKNYIKKIIKTIRSKEIIAVPNYIDSGKLLENKTALITGGSGGIGFAIAKKLISEGCKVIITGTSQEKIAGCCHRLNSMLVKGMVLNLTEIHKFEDKILEAANLMESKNIDILINCAGYNPKKGFFDIVEDDYDKTMNINVKGTFFMCQAMSKFMIHNNIKGHILNLSSSSALRPAWSPYEMSKWNIKGFTVGLADTLIPFGIIVNAIAPGPTATPMLNKVNDKDLELQSSPIGRYATPDEIANLALILVSDYGNLIIGDTLYATGGSGIISLHR